MGAGPFMLIYSRAAPILLPVDNEDEQQVATDQPKDLKKQDYEAIDESKLLEELSQWHPAVRRDILRFNNEFRNNLETAGIVDSDGRIIFKSDTPSSTEKRNPTCEEEAVLMPSLWEDPLSKLDNGESAVDYDDDAQEAIMEDTTNSYTGAVDIDIEMEEQAALHGWGKNTKQSTLEEWPEWGPSDEATERWENSLQEGQKSKYWATDKSSPGEIEVQVTQTVQTTQEKAPGS